MEWKVGKKFLISQSDKQWVKITSNNCLLFNVIFVVQWCHLAASLCTSYWCLVDVSATCHLHQYLWVYHTLWIYENLFWPFLSVTTISLRDTCRKEHGLGGHKITLMKNLQPIKFSWFGLLCSYAPKASFAIRVLTLTLKSIRNSNLTVSQPITILPALFFHHATTKALKKKKIKTKHYKFAHICYGRKHSSQIISYLLTLVNLSKLPIDWLCPDLSSRPSLSLFSYRIRTESRASMSPPSVGGRDGFKKIELCRDNSQFASLHQSQFEN